MKENAKRGSYCLNGLAIFLTIIFVISIFIAADNVIPLQAAAVKSQSTTVANKSTAKKDKWTTLLQKYEKSKKVNQLIFVKYKGKSKANIVLYEKVNGKFKKVFACAGYVGKKGIGKKREGDKKTPTGTYSFTKAFGIKKNPGSKIKYIKLNKYYYWSGDRRYYNQMIDIRKVKASRSGEHLIDYKPQYNYALAIDYNKKCVYKKGSAIFLHCTGKRPYTGGCVAVKEKYMKKIMQTVDKNAKICIYPKQVQKV